VPACLFQCDSGLVGQLAAFARLEQGKGAACLSKDAFYGLTHGLAVVATGAGVEHDEQRGLGGQGLSGG